MYNTYWTKEEDEILLNNLGKMSYKMMEEFLPNRKEAGIRQRALLRLGINNNEYVKVRKTKWFCDQNFWAIPNIINSYWAGFMCADGCVGLYGKNKTSYRFMCGLSVKDLDHLNLFAETVNYTGTIKHDFRKSPSTENIVESVHLTIESVEQWHKDLAKNFNIIPNKTLRIGPPSLWRDELLFSFLAGYIDGDGCISKINDGRISLVCVSSSQDMLLWVQNFIDKRFPYQVGKQTLLPTTSSDTCQRLGFSGYKAALIFDYMRHIPVPKLERKWGNSAVIEAVEKYKNKRPDLFNFDNLPKHKDYLNFLPESVKE